MLGAWREPHTRPDLSVGIAAKQLPCFRHQRDRGDPAIGVADLVRGDHDLRRKTVLPCSMGMLTMSGGSDGWSLPSIVKADGVTATTQYQGPPGVSSSVIWSPGLKRTVGTASVSSDSA